MKYDMEAVQTLSCIKTRKGGFSYSVSVEQPQAKCQEIGKALKVPGTVGKKRHSQ